MEENVGGQGEVLEGLVNVIFFYFRAVVSSTSFIKNVG